MSFSDPDRKIQYNRKYYQKHHQMLHQQRTPASERRVVLSVRLPPSLVGRLSQISIHGKRFGGHVWKNQSHMVEDLLIRGMGTIHGVEEVDEALEYLHATQNINAISAHRREAQAAFARVKTELTELLKERYEDEACHHYRATVSAFQKMSSTVWRDWFLKKMTQEFPKLAAMVPKNVHLDDEAAPAKVKAKAKVLPHVKRTGHSKRGAVK